MLSSGDLLLILVYWKFKNALVSDLLSLAGIFKRTELPETS